MRLLLLISLLLMVVTTSFAARKRAAWSGSLISQYLRGEGGSKAQRKGMAGRPEKAANKRQIRRTIMRVDELLRANKSKEALMVLKEAKRHFPGQAEIALVRGYVLERLGRIGAARGAYKEAISLDTRNVAAITRLGALIAEQGSDEKTAEGLLKRSLDLAPGNHMAYDSLGWLAFKKGDLARAESLFEKARVANDEAVSPLYHIGLVALRKKDLAKAMSVFQQVTQRDPTHDRAHISLGMLYERLGERQKAKEELSKALNLVGMKGPVARRIIKSMRRLSPHWRPVDSFAGQKPIIYPGLPSEWVPKKPVVAKVESPRQQPRPQPTGGNSLLVEKPRPPKPRHLSLLPERPKRPPMSTQQQVLQQAVASSRSFVHRDLGGDHMRLGRLYYEVGLMEEAAGQFQTVINLAPLSSEAKDAKDLVEALDDFADPTDDEKVKGYLAVGAALWKRSDLENAKLQYKKILLLRETDAVAHKNLAYIYLKEGRQNEAWMHVEEALKAQEDNPEALILKGYVQAKRRNFRDAEATFIQITEIVGTEGNVGRYAREMAEKMALFTELR